MSVSGASLVPKVGRRSICGRLVAPTGYIFTTEGIIRDTNLSYVLMIFIRKTWQGNLVRLRLLESRTFLKGVIPKKVKEKRKLKYPNTRKNLLRPSPTDIRMGDLDIFGCRIHVGGSPWKEGGWGLPCWACQGDAKNMGKRKGMRICLCLLL